MKNEASYKHVNLTPEEGKLVTEELDALFKKHSVELVVTPLITREGTIGAKVEIFKKVELVPKDAILSPAEFQPGANGDGETATA